MSSARTAAEGSPVVRSMTGFGRGEARGAAWSIGVETRSVNHRYLDLSLRLPPVLAPLELEIRRLVQSRLDRGRLDVTVQLTAISSEAAGEIRVDTALGRRHVEQARALARELGLSGDVTLAWVLERPGVLLVAEGVPVDVEALAPLVTQALSQALDELVARRTAEGTALAAELRGLHAELQTAAAAMAARAPAAATRRAERFRERLSGLLSEVPLDETRVMTEVALWIQKSDVTEELARLRAHLDELASRLDKGGPVGRPLDFLIQELHREVNTVAAKADDLELGQAALAAKAVIEKMREQVQNLE